MHPFSIAGNDRRTLEADDVAALSELYPEPTLRDHDGHDHRHGDPLRDRRAGARRQRAGDQRREPGDPAHARHRLRRQDRRELHDQRRPARRVRRGRRAAGRRHRASSTAWRCSRRVDTDFTQEYLNKSKEGDCAQDTDPNAQREHPGRRRAGRRPRTSRSRAPSLALVVDVTGSMGPEIGAIKTGLDAMISGAGGRTAAASRRRRSSRSTTTRRSDHVSRDPDGCAASSPGLTTHSTPDCPEGSNAALMTAGRLLGSGGRAVLVTDAESHPTGPSRDGRRRALRVEGRAALRAAVGQLPASRRRRAARARGHRAPPRRRPRARGGGEPRRGAAGRRARRRERRSGRSARRACSPAACSASSPRSSRARPTRTRATRTRWPTSRSRRSLPAVAAVEPARGAAGHDARRRADRVEHGLPRREHGRGRRLGRVGGRGRRPVADAHDRAADGRAGRRRRASAT